MPRSLRGARRSANSRSGRGILRRNRKGFQFPVLIGRESENWKAWGNTMRSTVHVVDQNGYIRFWWQGELNWQGATGDQQIELLVDALLKE